MTQKDAGLKIGVDADSVRNWEAGRSDIEVRFYPKLFSFLGYNPLPQATTLPEAIRRERLTRGLSGSRLAQLSGIDEATLRRIEEGTPRLSVRTLKLVGDYLAI